MLHNGCKQKLWLFSFETYHDPGHDTHAPLALAPLFHGPDVSAFVAWPPLPLGVVRSREIPCTVLDGENGGVGAALAAALQST